MDPALIGLDWSQAGAIVADMIVSYLAAGAPPIDPEEPNECRIQDCRSTPVEAGVHLHPPIDSGSSPVQPREHGSTVQPSQQSPISGLEPGADSSPRPRSRPIWDSRNHPHGLQDPGQRCGDGPGWGYLCSGGIAVGAIEPGLA